MEEIKTFKVCSDYRRDDLDYAKIQSAEGNPKDKWGVATYPYLIPSSHGSSFTYRVSSDWFFKRKLQDGAAPLDILSQHHFNQAYNELCGTLDDLGEVISYFLVKNVIDPQTGKPFVHVPEYRLATYTDKENITYRGCLSKNICQNPNEKIVTMAEMMTSAGLTGNSIEVYMKALKLYASGKKCKCDFDAMRRSLILNSYVCWKLANSDNHKHNVIVLSRTLPDGTFEIVPAGMIDNGSSYELSSPYTIGGVSSEELRLAKLLKDEEFSSVDENGNRVFDFAYYPFMHTAFHLNPEALVDKNTKINGKNFAYEYSLASEMLEDKELFRTIYEFEKQLKIESAIEPINEIYGASVKGAPKTINWPPLLREFMFETNNVKSKTIAYVVADYYLSVAYSATVGKADKENPSKQYAAIAEYMLTLPLQQSKEAYDEIFVKVAENFGVKIDKEKLAKIEFKLKGEMAKPEQQPN